MGLLALLLGGCGTLALDSKAPQARSLAEVAERPRWVRVQGVAPIAAQPGTTPQARRLQAQQASTLRAYQALAARVHGQYLVATTTVQDQLIESDRVRAEVEGVIRGAQIVEQYPQGDDTYVTVLEADLNQLQRAGNGAAR